jgi:hypothetical protein
MSLSKLHSRRAGDLEFFFTGLLFKSYVARNEISQEIVTDFDPGRRRFQYDQDYHRFDEILQDLQKSYKLLL